VLTQLKPSTGQHLQKPCSGKQQMEQNQIRAFTPALCTVTVSRPDRQAALTQPILRTGSGLKLQAAAHSSRYPLLLSREHRRPQPMLSTLSTSRLKVGCLKQLCVALHLACQLKPVSQQILPPFPLRGAWMTPKLHLCCNKAPVPGTAISPYHVGTPRMKNTLPRQTSLGGIVQKSNGGSLTGLASS